MPTWKYNNRENPSPSLPLFVFGDPWDWSMAFVNDTGAALESVYLCTDVGWQGYVKAKLHSEADYRLVMGPRDSACYLGTLPVGSTEIDFILDSQDESLANFVIPIYMVSGIGAEGPNQAWSDTEGDLWAPCYERQHLWRETYAIVWLTCTMAGGTGSVYLSTEEPQLFEDSADPPLWIP